MSDEAVRGITLAARRRFARCLVEKPALMRNISHECYEKKFWLRNSKVMKYTCHCLTVGILAPVAGCLAGCWTAVEEPTGLAALAAARAIDTADRIGGTDGFGGTRMNGYMAHVPLHIGYHGQEDLATADGGILVRLHNDAQEDCTFQLSCSASHMTLDERAVDVVVPAGEETTIELPCSQLVGLGPLDRSCGTGFQLAGGETVNNTMAVPGFLGLDYVWDRLYQCFRTPDIDHLDGDGDTKGLILLSDAMVLHMAHGGPIGHMQGNGRCMMGQHVLGS